jgi:hypothetical protein
MAKTLELIALGDGIGVVLSADMVAHLKVGAGDTISAIETPEGYLITSRDPDFVRQMEAAREFMREHRDALSELAKSELR